MSVASDPGLSAAEAALRSLRLADAPTSANGARVVDLGGSSWEPLDLFTAAERSRAIEPPSIVRCADGRGLLYPGTRHLISGPPETMKTWLCLVACAERMASGETVVWIDADGMGAGPLLERLRALEVVDALTHARFVYVAPDSGAGAEQAITAVVALRTPGLMVCDSYNAAMSLFGLKTASVEDIERFRHLVIQPFHLAGAASLMIDHVVKDKEARQGWAFGGAQGRRHRRPHPARGLWRRVDQKQRRFCADHDAEGPPGPPRAHWPGAARRLDHLHTSGGGARLLGAHPRRNRRSPAPWGALELPPHRAEQAVSCLLEMSSEPQSITSVEEAKLGRAKYVRQALAQLVAEGYVELATGPRNARLHSSIRPFREHEDGSAEGSE